MSINYLRIDFLYVMGKLMLAANSFYKKYAQNNNVHRFTKIYLVLYLNAAVKMKIHTCENLSMQTFHPQTLKTKRLELHKIIIPFNIKKK